MKYLFPLFLLLASCGLLLPPSFSAQRATYRAQVIAMSVAVRATAETCVEQVAIKQAEGKASEGFEFGDKCEELLQKAASSVRAAAQAADNWEEDSPEKISCAAKSFAAALLAVDAILIDIKLTSYARDGLTLASQLAPGCPSF